MFQIAAQFLEVLSVFGEVGDEIEERIRYAKWKTTDIMKALNEGRVPTPGPPGAEAPTSDARGGAAEAHSEPQALSNLPSSLPSLTGSYGADQRASPPAAPPVHERPAAAVLTEPLSPVPPPAAAGLGATGCDPVQLAAAERHTRYATSALQFEDVPTAIRELEHALDILRRMRG